MDRGRRGLAAEAALCSGIVLVWAAPVLPRLLTHLRDGYDALFASWALAWLRHVLASSPLHLLDANAFAPIPRALAHSDPLVGYGLLSVPFAPWGTVGAFNLTCLLALSLSVFAVVRLARSLGASFPAAMLGAAAACLGALAATDLGYVPFTLFGGIALLVLAWRALLEGGGYREATLLGLEAGLLGLFSVQLLAFGGAGVGVLALVDLVRERRNVRFAVVPCLLAAGAVAALVLAPIAIPLVSVRRAGGFARTPEEMLRFSAVAADWRRTSPFVPGQQFLGRTSDSETSLYPGTLALLLAAAALATRRARASRLVAPGAVLAAAGIAFSFGPRGPGWLLVHGPPAPVFGAIRAFARFALVAQIGFALLAAAGVEALLAGARSRRARAALVAALALLVFLDVRQRVPFGFRPEPPAAAELAAPVLHLPFTTRATDAQWLHASISRFTPTVNGYASFTPRAHEKLAGDLAAEELGGEMLDRLKRWPVATLVVHEHALPLASLAPTLRMAAEGVRDGSLRLVRQEVHRGGWDDVLVFGTAPSADASAFLARAGSARDVRGLAEADFLAAVDEPAEGQAVDGVLVVRGWSRTTAGPTDVVDVTIDGERRAPVAPVARGPRPDACGVFPALCDCSAAGYEIRFARLPGDAGTHELRVVFRSADRRLRTLARRFAWKP